MTSCVRNAGSGGGCFCIRMSRPLDLGSIRNVFRAGLVRGFFWSMSRSMECCTDPDNFVRHLRRVGVEKDLSWAKQIDVADSSGVCEFLAAGFTLSAAALASFSGPALLRD